MRHSIAPAAVAGFALALTGCAAPSPAIARSPQSAPEACAEFRFQPVEFWVDAEAVHPGETLPLKAVSGLARTASFIPPAIPASCLVDWRITPAGAAALSADGLSLVVSSDVRIGEILTLEARAPDGPVARHVRTIEDPASPPAEAPSPDESEERVLAGLWRQVGIECSGPQPSEPVRELEFRAPGRFWVTFLPFETYRDYWGQVDFDPAAGRLTLTVEGGNNEPENAILSGAARLENDGRRLVLDGFNLGNAHHFNSGWPCRYEFAR